MTNCYQWLMKWWLFLQAEMNKCRGRSRNSSFDSMSDNIVHVFRSGGYLGINRLNVNIFKAELFFRVRSFAHLFEMILRKVTFVLKFIESRWEKTSLKSLAKRLSKEKGNFKTLFQRNFLRSECFSMNRSIISHFFFSALFVQRKHWKWLRVDSFNNSKWQIKN